MLTGAPMFDVGPVAGLFPPRRQREHWDELLTQALSAACERVSRGPVTPKLDLDAFRRELAGFDFSAPQPMNKLFSWVIHQMEHGLVHVTHPSYFGLFNPAPTFPAQCADRITAAFNPQLASSTTSPVAVAMETHVIRAVATRLGLPVDASGHFTTGGAEANYTALVCALTQAETGFASIGARAFAGPPTFYVSRESHLAWFKIAHQSGIGRDAVRLIATDGGGRLDPQSLREAIAADRATGHVPVMVVATAGTTNAGMIDPLVACASIARENRLWYHVDAAWGGALIAFDGMRSVLSGIERADSVTIDAHKWFAATMGCGMFVIRDATVLSAAFQISTGYMPSQIYGVDPYMTSVQWSRRFLGLRLFMSLAVVGWVGYGRHIERALEISALLRQVLAERGWSIANRSPLAVVCFEPPCGSNDVRSIVGRVLASGRAWVSTAQFEGRDVIRACITHGETKPENIFVLVEALEAARRADVTESISIEE
jgi:glutamate/tyrosine decarboxylase-like PLP-dependent enzyme